MDRLSKIMSSIGGKARALPICCDFYLFLKLKNIFYGIVESWLLEQENISSVLKI